MASITQDSIENVKSHADIVDLIGSYIEIRKVGSNFMALCPFHDDKSASLSISPLKGLYHCFACGASGDSIKFVMEYERLSFYEAVEKIASIFHIQLEYTQGAVRTKSEILPALSNFYHNQLFKHNEIISYLYDRGINLDSIKTFEIGYCAASYETIKEIQDKKLPYNEALEYGLITENYNKAHARFANRIVFPIHSINGRVVGFGGRTLSNEKNVAKYLNSPQSKIFNKSKILYGYHLARQAAYSQKSLIVCEGYLDVILLHQAGIKNVVATLGTALNEGHLGILNRDNLKIYMCYDGDKAGINAAFKAAKFLSKNNKDGGVVILKDGLDPADMIKQNRLNDFKGMLGDSIPFVDFVLRTIILEFDLKNPVQKSSALNACLEYMHTLDISVQRDYKESVLPLLLNVMPHDIKTKNNNSRASGSNLSMMSISDSISEKEANILCGMLYSEENLHLAMEFLESRHFSFYAREFEMILRGNKDFDEVFTLRAKSRDKDYSLESFREDLRAFLLLYAQNLMTNIRNDKSINAIDRLNQTQRLKKLITMLMSKKYGGHGLLVSV